MKRTKLASIVLASSVLLAACQTTAPVAPQAVAPVDPYPEWVMNPVIENGLAAASCVPIPGSNISVAQKMATANGRAQLSFQIETKVKAMDKTYDRVTTTNDGASTGGTFESVSKQVTQQNLNGARAVKFAKVVDDGKNLMCALVTLSPETTNTLFSALVQSSEKNLSPDNEAVLKEQFLSYKAQQELEQEMSK
jgi:predicted component of type VI protein secretion system